MVAAGYLRRRPANPSEGEDKQSGKQGMGIGDREERGALAALAAGSRAARAEPRACRAELRARSVGNV